MLQVRNKIRRGIYNKCVVERENVGIKTVMKNTNNLFGTDRIELFKLWNSPISSFCQEIKGFTNAAESLKY